MEINTRYDVAIVGGGLAGLALSIQLARLGHSVVLFEKEKYPSHKVCGEYISLEAWDFLQELGLDLDGLNVPLITELEISTADGKLLKHRLPLGGFGISRYRLDQELARLAISAGVILFEGSKVNSIDFNHNEFSIALSHQHYQSKLVCGCFGKRSNIDIKWKRPFSAAAANKLNNYIGVKYHIKGNFDPGTISLHLFKHGYCGLVKVETGEYNLCYLSTASNLQENNNSIPLMEKNVLGKNPFLKKIFEEQVIDKTPLTISQVSFDKKTQVEQHVLMLGDAAGMITPLCGNGMSMALHASKLAVTPIHKFLQGTITRDTMEKRYAKQWQKTFDARLKTGRRIQRLFRHSWLTRIFISVVRPFPKLVNVLITKTHGKPF